MLHWLLIRCGVWAAAGLSTQRHGWSLHGVTHGNLDRTLKRYQREHHRALSGHNWMTSDYSTGRGFNPIEQLIFSATKDPALAAHVEAFGSRCIGVWQFLSPLAILRVLWVNITHRGVAESGMNQANFGIEWNFK